MIRRFQFDKKLSFFAFNFTISASGFLGLFLTIFGNSSQMCCPDFDFNQLLRLPEPVLSPKRIKKAAVPTVAIQRLFYIKIHY
jgi:hypothetical protein